jgi:agmatinase
MPELDPNAPADPGAGLYGLSVPPDEAAAVAIPVPFDATCSYRRGAARGPAAILRASHQVELRDLVFGEPWRSGICMLAPDPRLAAIQEEAGAEGASLARRNELSAELNAIVEREVGAVLDRGALPVVVGGDHSVPFGAFAAVTARHPGLGILHFDAHSDLREAYEGLTFSHASILFNAMTRLDGIARLVQVGIRDPGPAELERIESSGGRIQTLFDHVWARAKLAREDLRALVQRALEPLPEEIWITFDVDGLDPSLCPGTGTPVPGGLTWHEVALWLEEVGASGRRVLGADLVEVAPGYEPAGQDSLDAMVGARLLYRLIGTAIRSQDKV